MTAASEPTLPRCPECGGSMKAVYLGELDDKHFECEYCASVVDVADRSSVTHEEVESFEDDEGNRVRRVRRVTRRRVDGGAALEGALGARVRDAMLELDPGSDLACAFEGPDGRLFHVDLSDADAARAEIERRTGHVFDDTEFERVVGRVRAVAEAVRDRVAGLARGGGPMSRGDLRRLFGDADFVKAIDAEVIEHGVDLGVEIERTFGRRDGRKARRAAAPADDPRAHTLEDLTEDFRRSRSRRGRG